MIKYYIAGIEHKDDFIQISTDLYLPKPPNYQTDTTKKVFCPKDSLDGTQFMVKCKYKPPYVDEITGETIEPKCVYKTLNDYLVANVAKNVGMWYDDLPANFSEEVL